MTTTASVETPDLTVRPRYRRRGAILAASTILAAAILVAGVVFVHWRNGLRLFPSEGGTEGRSSLAVGRSWYLGDQLDAPNDHFAVDIDALDPVVTANSADATVRVLMCAQGPLTQKLGDDFSLTKYCTTARPFTPGHYAIGPFLPTPGTTVVVLQITPHRAGRVHVAGLHIRYHRGLRHGDQVTGIDVDTRSP